MGSTKKIRELLLNAIFEVFEKMFYIFLEPVDKNVKYDMVASIDVNGSIKGQINAFFSQGMAESMVKNMLGIQAGPVTDKLIEDCTKEAVNMISGNFLHKYNAAKAFDLFIPFFEKKSGIFVRQEEASSENVWNLFFESDKSLLGIKMSIIKS